MNLCSREIDAEFERTGRQFVIENLAEITTELSSGDCMYMDAIMESYRDQVYFAMYMSNIIDPKGFNEQWKDNCGEVGCEDGTEDDGTKEDGYDASDEVGGSRLDPVLRPSLFPFNSCDCSSAATWSLSIIITLLLGRLEPCRLECDATS